MQTKRARSIVQVNCKEHKCFFTKTENVCMHHCIPGIAYRKKCDKWGLWVWLDPTIHMALHTNRPDIRRTFEVMAQQRFENLYGHDLFIKEFGKDYIAKYGK